MKEKIYIYEKDPYSRKFLHYFFENREDFQAEFIDNAAQFKKKVSNNRKNKSLCIISSSELGKLMPARAGQPVIALISENAKAGIGNAIKHRAENYLIRPFYKEDLEYKIRTVFDRGQLVERLRKDAINLQIINELTYLASSSLDPAEILYLTVKKISEMIKVARCSIIRVDAHKKYAYVVATYEDPKLRNIKLDLDKYPEIKKALTTKAPVVVHNVARDSLMKNVRNVISPLGIHSIVVIPIAFHKKIIGTLFLRTSRERQDFTENEIKMCNAIANASANSLHNALLFERMEHKKLRLEKVSVTDYLTGIYNIRYFYQRLAEEFSRAERYNLPISCLMLDIDHFKKINDKYGHRTGDIVLREVAQLLKKLTRTSDLLARYGGEEFIMLLTQTSITDAMVKADALRSFIELYKFQGLKSGNIRVSIGVASYPENTISKPDDLITLADNSLYAAKKSGRNRIVVSNQ